MLKLHYRYLMFLAAVSSVAAANAYAFSEEDMLSDIPQITSATRILQPLNNAPVATSVISRKMIEASGMIEIPELLRLVPGFQVFSSNYNKYAVTYHGESSEYPNDLEVRINGRPVHLPLLSAVDWNSLGITIDDIEYIEVVRGSNVPSYGSNALMGAINIVTRAPISEPVSRLTAVIGADKRRDYTATFSNVYENSQYRFSLSGQKNDGFSYPHDGEEVYQSNFQVTLTPTLYDTFEFSSNFSKGNSFIDRGDISEYQQRRHVTNFQHFLWRHGPDTFNEYRLQLFHNYLSFKTSPKWMSALAEDPNLVQLNTYLDYLSQTQPALYPFATSRVSDKQVLTTPENGSVHVYGGELQISQHPTASLNVASGIGFRYERARSEAFLVPGTHVDEENYYAFSNIAWQQTPKLLWNLGMMAVKATTTPDPAFSIRAGANYQLDNETTVRASMTQAFRTPSLMEQNGAADFVFPEGIPFDYQIDKSDDLKPEKLESIELGLFLKHPSLKGFSDIKVFFENGQDGIDSWFYDSPPDIVSLIQGYPDETRQPRNVFDYHNRGLEIQTWLQPSSKDIFNFSYSYNNISGIFHRGSAVHKPDHNLSKSAPKHTISLLYNHKVTSTLDAGFLLTHVSPVRWHNSKIYNDATSLDIKLSKEFMLSPHKKLRSTILIENMLNTEYAEFHRNNEQERRFYLILQLSL